MPKTALKLKYSQLVVAYFVAATGACSDPATRAGKPASAADVPAPAESAPDGPATAAATAAPAEGAGSGLPPQVALADAPRIDLLANRYRFHLHGDDGLGLVVPVAAEGFRKYSQEYRSPWGDVVDQDGRKGRRLASSRAILRVPWRVEWAAGDERLVLTLGVHGLVRGQRITATLNGKRVGNLTIEPGWRQVDLELPAGAVRPGENELVVFFGKRGAAKGGKAYALVHSVAIGPATAAPNDPGGSDRAWPSLSPVATVAGKAALAAGGVTAAFEIPASAHLVFEPVGAGGLQVRARLQDGGTRPLFGGAAGKGADQQVVSLADLAGQLVELELRAEPGAGFASASIALEAARVAPPPPPVDNVVLLVVDALRSDRLPMYDANTRVRTPRMTGAFAERGAVMAYNQAASPSSPPSHSSIQTGMIPRVHGVVGDSGKLYPNTPMISSLLGKAGVATAYYGNNPFGMARLEAPGKWTEFHQPLREGKGHDCKPLVADMLDFAGRQAAAQKRFFISSLPYEPHTPYRYHDGITERYHDGAYGPPVGKSVDGVLLSALAAGSVKLRDEQWQELFALYDGEVEYWDGCFGAFWDGLRELGLLDRTAIVLTGDHGEGMFEHGRGGHAFGHYAELANVPFVIFRAGLAEPATRVEVATSHLDIAPTILDLMGVPAEPKVQGRTVIPMVLRAGPWLPRVVSLEYGRSYALRGTRFKYIVDYQQQESVFDLVEDPTEQTDILETQPIAVRYLRDLAGFFLVHRSKWHTATMGDWNNHSEGFLEYLGDQH